MDCLVYGLLMGGVSLVAFSINKAIQAAWHGDEQTKKLNMGMNHSAGQYRIYLI